METVDLSQEYSAEIIETLLKAGISRLNPVQEEAIKKGVLKDESFIISSPTASGKTLIAELTMLKCVMKGKSCLYMVPLKALASEKFHEFSEKYSHLGIRIGIATGDYDTKEIEDYDILIATSEKVDSMLRHRIKWIENISLVICDEIHLINDPKRGPTLEIVLSRLLQINPSIKIIGLSATIMNAKGIAEWLNAGLIQSDWRPVELREGIYYDGILDFGVKMIDIQAKTNDIRDLVSDSLKEGGQVLIFTSTRQNAEKLAEKLSSMVKAHLNQEELRYLNEARKEVLRILPEPTKLCKRLSSCISSGIAFHHAGLHMRQRSLIEDLFRSNKLLVITATPTLAMGLNLPARRVIIHDYRRYTPMLGRVPILVLEYKQMAGRAGRPKYDSYGEAILIAKTWREREFLFDNYIYGDPERVESKLGVEPVLRSHVLSSIATEFVKDEEDLLNFFKNTFYAYQYGVRDLNESIKNTLSFLERENMIKRGKFKATRFGKRVSELYIDPLSAIIFRNALKKAEEREIDELDILHTICHSPDMDLLMLRRSEYSIYEDLADREFLVELPDKFKEIERYELFLSELKTASMLKDWIDEVPEDKIVEKHDLGPGDIRNKVELANWLLYSLGEISKIFRSRHRKFVFNLNKRVQYGVKEELLSLVSLRGIGRARARKLYTHGLKTKEDLKKASADSLSKIELIGEKVAISILKQLEEKEEIRDKKEVQTSFFDFQ
ncbi:MAG: DEAD/DEAH box helicase [Candidatus Hydrothermarchaeota archaeon]